MGIFNKLKLFNKKEKTENTNTNNNTFKQSKESLQSLPTTDGRLGYTFYDETYNPNKMYDSTNIFINPVPKVINGKPIYEVSVSWFGISDVTFFDSKSRKDDYTTLYAGIDLNLLQNDYEYIKFVIKALLNQDRVESYLKLSLKSEQEIFNEREKTGNNHLWPCGKYVGHAIKTPNGYKKVVDGEIGRVCHNLPEMQQERETYKTKKRANIENQISKKIEEIDKLKEDLNNDNMR